MLSLSQGEGPLEEAPLAADKVGPGPGQGGGSSAVIDGAVVSSIPAAMGVSTLGTSQSCSILALLICYVTLSKAIAFCGPRWTLVGRGYTV